MSANQHDASVREREIFFMALDHDSPGGRPAFLDGACGGDVELRAAVEALLANHVEDSFLQQPATGHASGATILTPAMDQPGDRIGRFKLLEKIGEGGCGIVYMAEQEEPVRRRVALKVIKPGMDTKSVIARFEAERQALAMMDHPHIAKVHDGGVTESGRPFFVMELVRGIRITEYCQDHALNTRDRLDLFTAVCSAVQHAHQKGIIHRDLKPSNILVTEIDGKPVPKVIDFGIAKATERKLTDKTFFTQFAQSVGTPAYMSPEQAAMSGTDIDTRSDIYSLGVLLYELLTGTTPFDAQDLLNAGFDEMRRIIRETEPPKPSTRLTQSLRSVIAAGTVISQPQAESREQGDGVRKSEIRHPKSEIESDLDWIVMKCLEKDRARRYETASGLAADIWRHLSSEPVTARPASAAYRFRKMVRRNNLAFAAGSAVFAALIAGLGISVWQSIEKTQALDRAQAAEKAQSEERKKAETEAGKSRNVARFLKSMLAGVGPSVALGRDTKLFREILDKTAASLSDDLKDQPEVEAELRTIIGKVYNALGEYEKAGEMFGRALVITKKLRGDEHQEVAALLTQLATVRGDQGRLDEAEAMHREALAMQRKLPGGEHADVSATLNNLGTLVAERGRLEDAEAIHREALAMNRKFMGDGHEDVAISLNNLAVVLEQLNRLDEAESVQREALEIQRKQLGNEHPEVAISLNNLANVVQRQSKLPESESLFREVLGLQRKLLGNAHPNVAAALNGLGLALHKQGQDSDAEPLLREGVEIEKKARTSAHPQTAALVGNLGRIMESQRQYAEAESLYQEALTICANLPGGAHPDAVNWRKRLAGVLETQKKWAALETMGREDLDAARRAAPHGEAHPDVAAALKDLAATLNNRGKPAEAEPFLREAVGIYRQLPPGTDPQLARALGALGGIMEAQRKYPEAESLYREARAALSRKSQDGNTRFVSNWHSHLAAVLEKQGKFPEAETMRREALKAVRELAKPDPARLEPALYSLSESLHLQNKFAEAEPLLRELIESMQARLGKDSEQLQGPRSRLGRLLADWAWTERGRLTELQNTKSEITGRAREAERLLRHCLEAWLRGGGLTLWTGDEYRSRLGGALLAVAVTDPALPGDERTAQFIEAEALLLEGNQTLQQNKAVESKFKRDSLTRLVRLYEAWDKPDRAANWQEKLDEFDKAEARTATNPDSPEP